MKNPFRKDRSSHRAPNRNFIGKTTRYYGPPHDLNLFSDYPVINMVEIDGCWQVDPRQSGGNHRA